MLPLVNLATHAPVMPPRAVAPRWRSSLSYDLVEAPQIPFRRPLSAFSMRILDPAIDAIAPTDFVSKGARPEYMGWQGTQ